MNRFSVLAFVALSACATTPAVLRQVSQSEAQQAQAFIRKNMREPDSAEFRNFRAYQIANGETAICADLNGRNGFGGMTGFHPALVILIPGNQSLVYFDDLAAAECGALQGGFSNRFAG